MRMRFLILSLSLLAAACGGADTASPTSAATAAPTAAPGVSNAPTTAPARDSTGQPDATSSSTAAPVIPEGPVAANFVTELADGSRFDLAGHDKPVYLVFWAEW